MKVLVISQARNKQVNVNLANVIAAASKIQTTCDVMIVGSADLSVVSRYDKVSKVIHFDSITDENNLAINIAPLIAEIAKGYTHVLTAADSSGKDILPRVAGILDMGQISDVLAISSPNIFKKPMYAGNVIAEVEAFDDIKFLTIRPTSFEPVATNSKVAIEKLTLQIAVNQNTKLIGQTVVETETVGLAQAKIIVSGGRSLGSKDEFIRLINGFANKIGAGVGASRAAVEAGYVSNDCQVGQTGKVVAPNLYIAVGISGAVQHIAGMKDSKKVLAINSDSNAQIFEYADYGFVGDLFEIVPELISQL